MELPDPNKITDNAAAAGKKVLAAPLAFAIGLIIIFMVWFLSRDTMGQSTSRRDLEEEVKEYKTAARRSDSLYRAEVDKNQSLSREFMLSQGVIKEQQQTMIAAKSVIDSATNVRNSSAQNFRAAAAPMVKKLLKQ